MFQLPCSPFNDSVWLEQTIAEFEKEKSTKDELAIPQRLNQQHVLEEYSIDACSEDQKKVLSYILQYLKNWYEIDKTSESLENFKLLRMHYVELQEVAKVHSSTHL